MMKALILSITLIATQTASAEWLGWAEAGGRDLNDWQASSLTWACQERYGLRARWATSRDYLDGITRLDLPATGNVFGALRPSSVFGSADQATGIWLANTEDFERHKPAGICINWDDPVIRVNDAGRICGTGCHHNHQLYAGCAK